jgi:hypothetical protein
VTTIFLLYRDDQLLGELTAASPDFPWHQGDFHPTPAFEEVRPLFERELELLDLVDGEQMAQWEAVWTAIYDLGVQLRPASARDASEDISEFLLHIDGDEAWWRI